MTVGLLGLQLAEEIQSAIHDAQTDPGGWRHQISNRGEPTAAYSATMKWLAAAVPPSSLRPHQEVEDDDDVFYDATAPRKRWLDLTMDGGVSLGFYTRATAGATLRAGLIRSPYWSTSRTPIAFPVRADAGPKSKPEIFALGTLGGNLWAWNSLMQGQFKDSTATLRFDPAPSHPSPDTPLKRWVGHWSWGGAGRLPLPFGNDLALGLGFQRHYLSATFGGPHERRHGYWGAYVKITWLRLPKE